MGRRMSSLESLAPDQRAVVALVLQQGRSYDDIAALLGIPADAVRARAHAGLDALAPANGLPPEVTGPIADYLLGQQPAGDAEATRGLLAESAPPAHGRPAWASGDVAPTPLPRPRRSRAQRAVGGRCGGGARSDGGARAAAAPRARGGAAAGQAPPASSKLGGALLIAAVIAVVGVVLFLVLRGGDDSGGEQEASATPAATRRRPPPRSRRSPTRSRCAGRGRQGQGHDDRVPAGRAAPVRHPGPGPAASRDTAAYAVWLTGPGGKARRLGFTNPVGEDGALGIQGPSEKDLAAFPALRDVRERRRVAGDLGDRQAAAQRGALRQAARRPRAATDGTARHVDAARAGSGAGRVSNDAGAGSTPPAPGAAGRGADHRVAVAGLRAARRSARSGCRAGTPGMPMAPERPPGGSTPRVVWIA